MCVQAVTLDGIEVVPPKDEHAMMQGVTQHPITVALCVGDWIKEWRAYTGGLLEVPSALPAYCLPGLESSAGCSPHLGHGINGPITVALCVGDWNKERRTYTGGFSEDPNELLGQCTLPVPRQHGAMRCNPQQVAVLSQGVDMLL